jgi:hypothetical protein
VALPGNQAETENTNIDLQRWEKLIYSTLDLNGVVAVEIKFALEGKIG